MEVTGTPDLDLSKKLIKLIKDQPFLYDKTLEEFKDESRKSEAWNVLAQSLNISAEEAQVRWARLRVDFGRHRRKMKEAEACGNRTRSWPLYGTLTWLAPHIKMRAKRGQRKLETGGKTSSTEYKSNVTHADWLMSSNGSVKVEVSPSIVMHNDQEDITESFIVSPDTADYEDDASPENSHLYDKHQGKLSPANIKKFTTEHDIEISNYMDQMRAAFGASNTMYLFSMSGDTFSWKRRLATGLVATLGQVKMNKVAHIDAYDDALDKSLELMQKLEENLSKFKKENKCLREERETALNKVTEIARLKAQWEKKIYGEFVAVLNAKKERIQALEEMMELNMSDEPQSTDGDREQGCSKTWKEEVSDEVCKEDEDPYAGDTDVDSDGDANMEHAIVPPAASCSLRRGHNLFSSSFDSDSSDPPSILPKRARASASKPFLESTSTSTSASTAPSVESGPKDVSEDGDDGAATGESTQDLISQM